MAVSTPRKNILRSRSNEIAGEIQKSVLMMVLLALFAGSLLSGPADARPIRFDFGGSWQPEFGDNSDSADIGFNFDLFGTSFSNVSIDSTGSISFGDSGLMQVSQNGVGFIWQTQVSDSDFGGELVDGFRVTWGTASDERAFQIGLFQLVNDLFVIELNYGDGVFDIGSFVGYDNGAGSVYNLLAPGNPNVHGCSIPTDPIADSPSCFDPALLSLSQATIDYFLGDPTDPEGDPNNGTFVDIGRYVFLIAGGGDANPVPEPGTSSLLLMGLAAWGATRRRRNSGKALS